MTAAKDMSRPASQHRLSVSSNASSLPIRNSYARSHSHSASLGSVNPANRIGRRKSSTFTKSSLVGAAVENAVADGSLAVHRRSSMSKAALSTLNDAACPAMPASLPQHAYLSHEASDSASAVVDGPSLSAFHDPADKSAPKKMRRASDGTRLTKKEKAAAGDLKCEHCGKAYKHGSCLSKHLWEHTPQWQYTSKLLISKHQQVQLLEAASVLVAMNAEAKDPHDSDHSSSPAASGSSDPHDEGASSAETTPPPHSEHGYRDSKRLSNTSSIYSRSYQSVFSSGSAPGNEPAFAHHRHWSASSAAAAAAAAAAGRPLTAHTSIAESYHGDEDPQDLAAAVGLLSCSYGTPKTGPTSMPLDVPPVPPLPAKYRNAQHAPGPHHHHHHHHHHHSTDDVAMDDDHHDHDSYDGDQRARTEDVEDDHGVFGMDA